MTKDLVVRREDPETGLLAVLKSLEIQRTLGTEPVLAALRHFPSEAPRYAPFPEGLHPKLRDVLGKRGIESLYTHQRAAYDAAEAGKSTVVVTPTASGKTLCYNLPVLDRILKDSDARALYLFPTKALSQDQLAELHTTVEALGADIGTFTYDGDTPQDARKAIRARAHVVVTNPDMLHKGILPHHTKWVKLLENLRYVIVDELHSYRGVYGSHVANIFRRLERICQLAALFLLCDRHDLGVAVGDNGQGEARIERGIRRTALRNREEPPPGEDFEPNIFLYDAYPGGMGLSEPLYHLHERLLVESRTLIAGCACSDGCPSCVGPAGEVGSRGKEVALSLLDAVLKEPPGRPPASGK